jgi:hypothetical protein
MYCLPPTLRAGQQHQQYQYPARQSPTRSSSPPYQQRSCAAGRIYDNAKLQGLLNSKGKSQNPEFFEPPSCPFYQVGTAQLSDCYKPALLGAVGDCCTGCGVLLGVPAARPLQTVLWSCAAAAGAVMLLGLAGMPHLLLWCISAAVSLMLAAACLPALSRQHS